MFDAKEIKEDIVRWIRDWFDKNGNGCNAVVGISGGKDSTVVAALCCEALGKERVIGVLMPNGEQLDIDVSHAIVKHLGIKYYTINVGAMFSDMLARLIYSHIELSEQTRINLPPRLRMATLYAVSQSVNGRVANTCNLSEDWVGYSTRYGDSVGDFSPLSRLLTDEVIAIGRECGVPEEFLLKIPSDGLCGKTDEDNLGFTYAALNEYIRTGECKDKETKNKIDVLHSRNFFKMLPMPCYVPRNLENERRLIF